MMNWRLWTALWKWIQDWFNWSRRDFVNIMNFNRAKSCHKVIDKWWWDVYSFKNCDRLNDVWWRQIRRCSIFQIYFVFFIRVDFFSECFLLFAVSWLAKRQQKLAVDEWINTDECLTLLKMTVWHDKFFWWGFRSFKYVKWN